MNGTVIDIPGVSCLVVPHYMEHSTDVSYTIQFVDQRGNMVKVQVNFGRITEVTSDILK